MKRINRFWVLFVMVISLLVYIAFISENVYINQILLYCGIPVFVLFGGWIFNTPNEKEMKVIRRLYNMFN